MYSSAFCKANLPMVGSSFTGKGNQKGDLSMQYRKPNVRFTVLVEIKRPETLRCSGLKMVILILPQWRLSTLRRIYRRSFTASGELQLLGKGVKN